MIATSTIVIISVEAKKPVIPRRRNMKPNNTAKKIFLRKRNKTIPRVISIRKTSRR